MPVLVRDGRWLRLLTPALSSIEEAREKDKRPFAFISSSQMRHFIRPAATFSPADAEKGKPMGEGRVELSSSEQEREYNRIRILALARLACGEAPT